MIRNQRLFSGVIGIVIEKMQLFFPSGCLTKRIVNKEALQRRKHIPSFFCLALF